MKATTPAAAGPAAPAQATPATTGLVLYDPATNTFANRYATFLQHVQQWIQGPAHYWQMSKNALTAKKGSLNLWAGNLIWGGNPQPHVRAYKALAIIIACMCIFMLASNLLMGRHATVPPDYAPTSTINISTSHQDPNGVTAAVSNCLWQIKQCIAFAFQTRLSQDGSYGPYPAPSSRTDFICEHILRTVMSYKAMRLAISQKILGDLNRCFDAALQNPMSSSGVYSLLHHFGRTASLCAAI